MSRNKVVAAPQQTQGQNIKSLPISKEENAGGLALSTDSHKSEGGTVDNSEDESDGIEIENEEEEFDEEFEPEEEDEFDAQDD